MEIFLFLVGRRLILQAAFTEIDLNRGYFVQFGASCILLYKIWKHKSIYGLSIDTQAPEWSLGHIYAYIYSYIYV